MLDSITIRICKLKKQSRERNSAERRLCYERGYSRTVEPAECSSLHERANSRQRIENYIGVWSLCAQRRGLTKGSFLVIQDPKRMERLNDTIRYELSSREITGESPMNRGIRRAKMDHYQFLYEAPTSDCSCRSKRLGKRHGGLCVCH